MNESRFLGDYRLIKHIGHGSMGSTFVAEQRVEALRRTLEADKEAALAAITSRRIRTMRSATPSGWTGAVASSGANPSAV